MKVLIANAPAYIQNNCRHFVQAGSRWSYTMAIPKSLHDNDHYLPYPFFLGYSSALLKRDFDWVKTKAIDACALDYDEKEFFSYVTSFKPDVLVIEIPTISFSLMMPVINEIKQAIGCDIVVAGSHVTALHRDVLAKYPFIDYCLLGEYEVTLKNLINFMKEKHLDDLKRIDGLAFRRNGGIFANSCCKLLEDLDYLPYPDRDDMPISNYHDFEIQGKPCVQMLSTRGCPSNCIFCVNRQVIYASSLRRKRDPKFIVDEMALAKKRGAKQIYFDDETMTIDRKHVTSISQLKLETKLDIPWACMGDITLDRDSLYLMAKAGCVGIKFGVETVTRNTLDSAKKTFMNTEKVRKFVKWCKELDIYTHATYLIGLPYDTEKEILDTINFALRLNTDSAQFAILTPFPGTILYDMAKKNNWLVTDDWSFYDGWNHSVLNYPWLSKEEIEKLHKMALKKWYRHNVVYTMLNPEKMTNLIRKKGLGHLVRKAKTLSKSLILFGSQPPS